MAEACVVCRTPTPGREGTTAIPAWKFDLLSGAILGALREGDIRYKDLAPVIGARLGEDDRARLGSLRWHLTSVKLELEVRGEIERVPGRGPQVLRLVREPEAVEGSGGR